MIGFIKGTKAALAPAPAAAQAIHAWKKLDGAAGPSCMGVGIIYPSAGKSDHKF